MKRRQPRHADRHGGHGDGATLYVAAFGSSKVGVFSTRPRSRTTRSCPSAADHIAVTGGGPSGLVLDEADDRLYVLTRFDNAISVVDTATAQRDRAPAAAQPRAGVGRGRAGRFLYDARLTSSNGEASCASCHVFGDFDSLAWDLGNPDDAVLTNPNPFARRRRRADPRLPSDEGADDDPEPARHGEPRADALARRPHRRLDEPNAQPDGGAFDEDAAFKKFNLAFVGLLGRGAQLRAAEMQAFTDFILQVPIRRTRSARSTTRSRATSRRAATSTSTPIPPTWSARATSATC